MSASEKDIEQTVTLANDTAYSAVKHDDDVLLAQLGYKSEFRREFSVILPVLLVVCRSDVLFIFSC
jgi:hypothetical protein